MLPGRVGNVALLADGVVAPGAEVLANVGFPPAEGALLEDGGGDAQARALYGLAPGEGLLVLSLGHCIAALAR